MLPVLAKVTERTKKKIEPFEKNQKDNFIVNRKITNCCYNIKIYVISIELCIERDHFIHIKGEITPVKT
jgi:hypothetical protein